MSKCKSKFLLMLILWEVSASATLPFAESTSRVGAIRDAGRITRRWEDVPEGSPTQRADDSNHCNAMPDGESRLTMTMRKYLACSAVVLLAVFLWLSPEIRPHFGTLTFTFLGFVWLVFRVAWHALKGR